MFFRVSLWDTILFTLEENNKNQDDILWTGFLNGKIDKSEFIHLTYTTSDEYSGSDEQPRRFKLNSIIDADWIPSAVKTVY